MLYLVGVSPGFTSERAHLDARAGEKSRLAQGVYCESKDLENLSEFLRANAIRIANYCYPNATLVQSSAYLKGPVESENSTPVSPRFKLFLAGSYSRVTKLPPNKEAAPILDIVQFNVGEKDIKRFATNFDDGKSAQFGEIKLHCEQDEMVFLHNFSRRRDQLERFLSDDQMISLREKLETRFSKSDLISRLSVIVQRTEDFGFEFGRAVQFLNIPIESMKKKSEPANLKEFTLGWHRRPVAKLAFNGVNWSFNYLPGWAMKLQAHNHAAQIPAFINNLLPEGSVRNMLRSRLNAANATLLETSERFMSNVSIVRDPDRLKQLPIDILDGRLKDFDDGLGAFKGEITGLPRFSNKMMLDLTDVITSDEIVRVAGMQPKIMMNLSFDGNLTPALGQTATHILKFPGLERDSEAMKGVVEWASMTLAKGSGLLCADFAMVKIKGEKDVLGYVTERFDIPADIDDMKMIFAEDICSMIGHSPEAKGMPSLNDVIDVVRKSSTNPGADMEDLFRQITVNYLLENADFHTKNASVLKIAMPMLDGFRSIRMAPAYDIMRTASFATIQTDIREPMQLGFHNEDEDFVDREWSHEDFVDLGVLCGITSTRSMEILRSCADGISSKAIETAQKLPDMLKDEQFAPQMACVMSVFEHAVAHCHEFFPDLPASLDVKKASQNSKPKRKSP